MFKIDSIVLSISDKKIKEHQRITGDTDGRDLYGCMCVVGFGVCR